ncbi:MAG: hypothetical protein QOI31_37 [Solirubrobacterales bacterium]|jgi:hypothetical protein|nr:hypothetical protein [Solirubrobacterales bacterium]
MGVLSVRSAIAAVVFMAAAPHTASADTNLGTVDGLTYISALTTFLPSPATATERADCPAGTKVVGGGVAVGVSGEEGDARIASGLPFDGGDANSIPDDGWEGRGANLFGGSKSMTVFAICSTGHIEYATDHGRLEAGAGSGTARCPGSTHISGGGVSVGGSSLDAWPTRSRPLDLEDGNSQPDDAWQTRVFNSGPERRLTTYAICVQSRRDYAASNSTGGASAFADCPTGGHGTGGGFAVTGPASESQVAANYPFDSSGMDPPDVSFSSRFAQAFGPVRTLTSYAICST